MKQVWGFANVGEYLRFLSLERDRDREWWCLELLGDLDDPIVCFL